MKEVHLPLSVKQMIQLQKNDAQAKNIVDKLRKEKDNAKMFIMHDGVLCRLWTEEKETFSMMVSCADYGQKNRKPSDVHLSHKY